MQLALYTRALMLQESSRESSHRPHRKVLPPAILAATTGRLIVMTEDEMNTALNDLQVLFESLGELTLRSDDEIPPRLSGEAAMACNHCPFAMGDIRLCAPEGEPLGLHLQDESE